MKNVMLCCSFMHVNTVHLQKAESGCIEIDATTTFQLQLKSGSCINKVLWCAFSVNEQAIRILVLYIPMSGCTIQGT